MQRRETESAAAASFPAQRRLSSSPRRARAWCGSVPRCACHRHSAAIGGVRQRISTGFIDWKYSAGTEPLATCAGWVPGKVPGKFPEPGKPQGRAFVTAAGRGAMKPCWDGADKGALK